MVEVSTATIETYVLGDDRLLSRTTSGLSLQCTHAFLEMQPSMEFGHRLDSL